MKVNINNLTFKTIIGILPFERKKRQQIIVDISFKYIYNKNSTYFIDYSKVIELVKKNIKKEKYYLIEDALLGVSQLLKTNFNIKKLKIKITKPDIIKDCKVSVSL